MIVQEDVILDIYFTHFTAYYPATKVSKQSTTFAP